MNKTAQEYADELGGQCIGNTSVSITHPAKIEEATKGSIAFLANMKYEDYLYTTNASAVIIPEGMELKSNPKATLIRVGDPYVAFVTVLNQFNEQLFTERTIHPKAVIHETAKIGKDVYIGANVVIEEGASVGDNTRIEANTFIGKFAQVGSNSHIFASVSLYHYCIIGNYNIIHSGVVIGSDGFGFAPTADGSYSKVPQVGNVVLGDHVEIGANTTIDRATMGSTSIGDGVKIDNLVQIGHNVVIDSNTVVAAQAGISGSTKLGKNVVVGGQAGFVGHITVADQTKVNAQSGVSKTIKEKGTALSGSPAFAWRDELKSQALFRNLPKLEDRVKILEEKINKEQ